jgi:TFIIF-interacting CTD phosphatase-like protein
VFKAEFAPERTCLVDNNPISFVTHPSNGIPIEPFYDNPQDMELSAVLDLLHVLNEESDVRPILKDLFKLHEKVPRIAG